MTLEPTSVEELQEAVRSCAHVIPIGAGTKPALSSVPEKYQRISTLHVSGIVEYDPSEFTITVLAGTRLKEIEKTLAEHGQYLPFDPPLAEAGATIGGTVAAGLSGPGAFRFGPVRDFLIGVRFVDGEGRIITGGGKVVKNAAGFDLPKFLIDSCGRFGVLAELTFKVFPKTETTVTFGIALANFKHAVRFIRELSRKPFDLDALDYEPAAEVLWGRIAGNARSVENRLRKLDNELDLDFPITICEPHDAAYFWKRQLGFDWAGQTLAKVPITPDKIERIESRKLWKCVYSIGGNVAWISGTRTSLLGIGLHFEWPFEFLRIEDDGSESEPPPVAFNNGGEIHFAVKQAFDPGQRFPSLIRNPLTKI